MLHGDSRSYFLSSSALRYRTLAYPLFMETVRAAFGTLAAVPKSQLLVAAASVVFIGWAAPRALAGDNLAVRGAPGGGASRADQAWSAALVALVLVASGVPRFHAYVLSEALFVPLLCVAAGFLVLWSARPAPWSAAAWAATIGLAAAVRPSAMFFAAAWPFMLWLAWDRCKGRRLRMAAAVAAPLIIVVAVENASRSFFENASGATQAGIMHRRIFSKAVMMKAEPLLPDWVERDAPLADLARDARASAAPLRRLVQRAPDWRIRAVVLRNAEAAGEMARYRRELRWRADDLAETRGTTGEALLGELGRAMLLSRPGEWAANAALHWRALWFLYSLNDAGSAARYAALVDGLEDDRAYLEAGLVAPAAVRPEPSPVVLAGRAGALAAFLASVAAVLLAVAERLRREPGRRDPGLAAAAVSSVMVHGYMIGTAVVAQVHLRYVAAIWPLQAVCCVLLLRWAVRRGMERGRKRRLSRQPGAPRLGAHAA